jgi:hypothetical protein
VYGVESIIEPTREVTTYAGTTTTHTVVNVWAWPSVQYVYGPYYSVWMSPWSWHLYPVWWHAWHPVAYVYYYPYWQPYRRYYSICNTYRIGYAHTIYRPYRRTSVVVYNRHRDEIVRYRSTYSGRDRYARRSDQRRSYVHTSGRDAHESRGRDIDRTRRSNTEASTAPSVNRSRSAERTVRPDIHQNSDARRSVAESSNSTVRPQVTTPSENRRATVTRPVEHNSMPARTVRPQSESSSTPRPRVSTPSENRSTSVARPAQRTSIPARTTRPEVQRAPASVRTQAPARQSTPVHKSTSRPQVSSPSINRSSPSSSHSVQRTSSGGGESRSGAARRGRN